MRLLKHVLRFSVTLTLFFAPFFLLASGASISITSVETHSPYVSIRAKLEGVEPYQEDFPRVWFEYGKGEQKLGKTTESIVVGANREVWDRIYEELPSGEYWVQPILIYQGEKIVGEKKSFTTKGSPLLEREEKENRPRNDSFYTYKPQDSSMIEFDDNGYRIERNSGGSFWENLKAAFGFSRKKEKKEEKEERKEVNEKERKRQNASPSGSYDTQYRKYYRAGYVPRRRTVQSLNYPLLILFLLFLIIAVILGHFILKRRRRRFIPPKTPPYPTEGAPPVPPYSPSSPQSSRPRVIRSGEGKYEIPHRDIQEVRKEMIEELRRRPPKV